MRHIQVTTYVREKLTEMFDQWGIHENCIHLILRDNGTDIVKTLTDASLPQFGCFAHTLQLVVYNEVLSQRAVLDLLSACRKIVGHFNCSCKAYSCLRVIQQNLGLLQDRLILDEPTRWNFFLYILQWIIQQKVALAAYGTEYSVVQLTSHQLELATKVVAALSPIEVHISRCSCNFSSSFAICIYSIKNIW